MTRRPGHLFYDALTVALIVAAAVAWFVVGDAVIALSLTVFAFTFSTCATRGDGR